MLATKIRIESDGTAPGTKVFAGDREIRGLTRVAWTCEPGKLAVATVEMSGVEVDLVGDVDATGEQIISGIRRCKKCGREEAGLSVPHRRLDGPHCNALRLDMEIVKPSVDADGRPVN